MVSSRGDVLIYAGTSPEDSDTWSLARRLSIPPPLSRRAYIELQNDVMIATTRGVVSLVDVLNNQQNPDATDKIQDLWKRLTTQHPPSIRWSLHWYQKKDWIIVNVPVGTNRAEQLVYNRKNGSWGRFNGWNAECFAMVQDRPFFGGLDALYEADIGHLDNGNNIYFIIRPAYNHFGNRASTKRFVSILPLVEYENSTEVQFYVDTNLQQNSNPFLVQLVGLSTPYGSPYGSPYSVSGSSFYSWFATAGNGKSVSYRVQGFNGGGPVSLKTAQVIFENGGVL